MTVGKADKSGGAWHLERAAVLCGHNVAHFIHHLPKAMHLILVPEALSAQLPLAERLQGHLTAHMADEYKTG